MQGFPYRSVPPIPGGTYRSTRLPVRRPSATGWYRQNRPSTVDFGHRRSIEGEKGKKKKKKKRKRRKKMRRRKNTSRRPRPRTVTTRAPPLPSPAGRP
ncbi:hypothetical protein GW17_00017369 [Ensete ventricosum]|nr:hypothetical protein GW17_00017369 [Ensete ventricosum]